jgi:hypothetical protein
VIAALKQSEPHFAKIGTVDVGPTIDALARYSGHFSDEKWRQKYPGSAHPDSETIYLRMPPVLTRDTLFNSLEVEDCPLGKAPEFAELVNDVAEQVKGRVARAMLVKLKAGGKIHPHIDQGIYAESTDRYHVPIITNRGAWLQVGDQRQHNPVGHIVYFEKHVLHEGANEGATDRVHLIIDFFRGTA